MHVRGTILYIRHRHTLFLILPSPSVCILLLCSLPPSGFKPANPQDVGGCAHREKEGLRTHTARNLGLMPAEPACGDGKRERPVELGSRKGLQTGWSLELVVAPLLPRPRGVLGSRVSMLCLSSAISGGQSDPSPMLQDGFAEKQMLRQRLARGTFFLGSTPRISPWRREELEAEAGREGNPTAMLACQKPQLTLPRALEPQGLFSVVPSWAAGTWAGGRSLLSLAWISPLGVGCSRSRHALGQGDFFSLGEGQAADGRQQRV